MQTRQLKKKHFSWHLWRFFSSFFSSVFAAIVASSSLSEQTLEVALETFLFHHKFNWLCPASVPANQCVVSGGKYYFNEDQSDVVPTGVLHFEELLLASRSHDFVEKDFGTLWICRISRSHSLMSYVTSLMICFLPCPKSAANLVQWLRFESFPVEQHATAVQIRKLIHESGSDMPLWALGPVLKSIRSICSFDGDEKIIWHKYF